MASADAQTAAPSNAQKRVVAILTEAEDPVTYSGNPAELSGARHEITKALRRAGAFKLLVTQNASRMSNGTIAVEDLDNILIVTDLVNDPGMPTYDYDTPCPDTPTRVARINSVRAMSGDQIFRGVPNITTIPDKILKICTVNQDEVQTEALAYALTQLSIFEDRQHANELLKQCDYDGRKLGPILDAIESKARAEDVSLVTGKRNKFRDAGLSGQPLTFASFRKFFKEFNVFEYKCPPTKRTSNDDLLQLVGNLFIKDPSVRKLWTSHVNAPMFYDATGAKVSGPPQTFAEAKALAEELLRSSSVIAGIDELTSPSGLSSNLGLSSEQLDVLTASNINPSLIPAAEAALVANALLIGSPASDPKKNLAANDLKRGVL